MTALVQVLPNTIEEVAKRKVGRPTKVTPQILARLEEQWMNGANDSQACFIAGITPQTLYTYQERNPEYLIKKEACKGNIALNAKHTIARHVKRDPELALKVVERLEKDTWSLRTELTGADGKDFTFKWVSDDDATSAT